MAFSQKTFIKMILQKIYRICDLYVNFWKFICLLYFIKQFNNLIYNTKTVYYLYIYIYNLLKIYCIQIIINFLFFNCCVYIIHIYDL